MVGFNSLKCIIPFAVKAHRKLVLVDVKMVNPLAPSYVDKEAAEPSFTVRQAEHLKRRTHEEMAGAREMDFFPLAFTTYGVPGPETLQFLNLVARKATGEKNGCLRHFIMAIGVAIQKGNAQIAHAAVQNWYRRGVRKWARGLTKKTLTIKILFLYLIDLFPFSSLHHLPDHGRAPPSNTHFLVGIPPPSLVPSSVCAVSPHLDLPCQRACRSVVFLSCVPHPRASSPKYCILAQGVGAEVQTDGLGRRFSLSPRPSRHVPLPAFCPRRDGGYAFRLLQVSHPRTATQSILYC